MKTCRHPELTALAYAGYAAIWRSIEAEEAKRKEDADDAGKTIEQVGRKLTATE